MGGIVSSISDLLGGGSNNAGLQAQPAPVINGTEGLQINNAYDQTQNGIGLAGTLANQLVGQGVQGSNNQTQLANALLAGTQGQGPNPVQAALNQNTGNNIAAQAALMAGARGGSANPGLIARQAGQVGAGIQQNAVGQAATLAEQQKIDAQNALANLSANQIGQAAGANSAYNSAAQGEQGILQNALAQYNNARVSAQNNANSTNASVANNNANNTAGAVGGLANAAGGWLGLTPTKKMASGGEVSPNPKVAQVPMSDRFAGGFLPDHLKAVATIYHADRMHQGGKVDYTDGGKIPGKAKVKGDSPKNDTVPIMASPGEVMLPKSVMESANPGEAAKAFVEHLHSKYGNDDEKDDFKMALQKAISTRRSKAA